MSDEIESGAKAGAVAQRKISEESAKVQVKNLFEAFEVEIDDEDDEDKLLKAIKKNLEKAVRRGRLEINGTGDDVKVAQHLHEKVIEKDTLIWNWRLLGLARSRIRMTDKGIATFGGQYTIASSMLGVEADAIYKMHPIDLSLLEDIASFFGKL